MKSNILNHTIAALLAAVPFTHADDKKLDEKKDDGKSSNTSASTSVVTSSDGTATVTVDINGRKETRTCKLGGGNESISVASNDGAKVGGGADAGGTPGSKFGAMRKEKGPWIGIAMGPVEEVVRAQLSLAPGEGVVISHIMPESPAAKAGLAVHDILLRFDDQILVEASQLRKLIAMKKPGDIVKLTYLRKGERKEANVTLVEHDLEPEGRGPMQWLGSIPGVRGRMDEQLRRMEEQLKQFKEKHPGNFADRWSWRGGPDGGAPWDRERFKGMLDEMRKRLEDSKLSKEEQDKIRKNIEEAMENARKAVENAMKDVKRWRKDENQEKDKAPKKPGEPL